MIRKSVKRFSKKIMLKPKSQSAMIIHPDFIALGPVRVLWRELRSSPLAAEVRAMQDDVVCSHGCLCGSSSLRDEDARLVAVRLCPLQRKLRRVETSVRLTFL